MLVEIPQSGQRKQKERTPRLQLALLTDTQISTVAERAARNVLGITTPETPQGTETFGPQRRGADRYTDALLAKAYKSAERATAAKATTLRAEASESNVNQAVLEATARKSLEASRNRSLAATVSSLVRRGEASIDAQTGQVILSADSSLNGEGFEAMRAAVSGYEAGKKTKMRKDAISAANRTESALTEVTQISDRRNDDRNGGEPPVDGGRGERLKTAEGADGDQQPENGRVEKELPIAAAVGVEPSHRIEKTVFADREKAETDERTKRKFKVFDRLKSLGRRLRAPITVAAGAGVLVVSGAALAVAPAGASTAQSGGRAGIELATGANANAGVTDSEAGNNGLALTEDKGQNPGNPLQNLINGVSSSDGSVTLSIGAFTRDIEAAAGIGNLQGEVTAQQKEISDLKQIALAEAKNACGCPTGTCPHTQPAVYQRTYVSSYEAPAAAPVAEAPTIINENTQTTIVKVKVVTVTPPPPVEVAPPPPPTPPIEIQPPVKVYAPPPPPPAEQLPCDNPPEGGPVPYQPKTQEGTGYDNGGGPTSFTVYGQGHSGSSPIGQNS